jgi:hypothetical protein
LLKTTKSGFVNFVKDSYTSLPDVSDRILSTVVDARWTYKSLNGLNFCQAFNEVEKALLDHFAGPPDTGLFSPSVQQTLYHAQVSHNNITNYNSDCCVTSLRDCCVARLRDCSVARLCDCCVARLRECCTARLRYCCVARLRDCCVARLRDCCVARLRDCCVARLHGYFLPLFNKLCTMLK